MDEDAVTLDDKITQGLIRGGYTAEETDQLRTPAFDGYLK